MDFAGTGYEREAQALVAVRVTAPDQGSVISVLELRMQRQLLEL